MEDETINKMISETTVINKERTDEEVYQDLKKDCPEGFMPADEWKAKRIEQLKKEGKNWTK